MKKGTLTGFVFLALFVLVAGVVVSTMVPATLLVKADSSILRWGIVQTPGSFGTRNDIVFRSEIDKLVVSPSGSTLLAVVTRNTVPAMQFFSSGDGGRSWGGSSSLINAMILQWGTAENVWDVAIAPDDNRFRAAVSSSPTASGPAAVWVTTDGGDEWKDTGLNLPPGNFISCIDISMGYKGMRDIAVGTRNGGLSATGKVYVLRMGLFGNWTAQDTPPSFDFPTVNNDAVALKFSPTYSNDSTIVIIYSTNTGLPATSATYVLWGVRDIGLNSTYWASNPIEIKDPVSPNGSSPDATTIVTADLELPSDFSGQAASLRRAYVSFFSSPKNSANQNGIYRADDDIVYELMDTTDTGGKDISSIAFYGTYASGKLLAGEIFGHPCTATVMTWFTDSPTTCPIPCWYPALKPTTGAAGIDCLSATGYGNAQVGWSRDGGIAYAVTGSACLGPFNIPNEAVNCAVLPEWPDGYLNLISRDESAFAISRNNGETWNQLSLIDTRLDKLTDVAPSPDCATIYLTSINTGTGAQDLCNSFDSVWRSSLNRDVTSPYAAVGPLGYYWERIFTHTTSLDCTQPQTDHSILRLVPYCQDQAGQIVSWAAQGTTAQAWSSDFGDYWAIILPRDIVQDFCFESITAMYDLSPDGLVQKLTFAGTGWTNILPSVDSRLGGAHAIAAYPEGKVLVGADSVANSQICATSFCGNFDTDSPQFLLMLAAGSTTFLGDVHPTFHPEFESNNIVFINDENYINNAGSVYRNSLANLIRWSDLDMMLASNGAVGCNAPHRLPQTGLICGFTGEAIYSSHAIAPGFANSGVCRTIDDGTGKFGPLSGIPKPGIAWDCLSVFVPAGTAGVIFTLQPITLKACGCCSLSSDTSLYAIDNRDYASTDREGVLWEFTDCLAKRGPALVTEDKIPIGCDPVSGRAQEVNLCWEQLCLANRYDMEIAKDPEFTIKVIDWLLESECGGLLPADVTTPCVFYPAGSEATIGHSSAIVASGNLECGHTYYWRVRARSSATTQDIRSPWSEVRRFTIKAGLASGLEILGLQLLAPDNGCLECRIKPASFSWSPFKETTKFRFVLAKDAAMTQIVKEAEVTTTAYEYDGTLDYGTTYFWRVMALEPKPSDWSATFSFATVEAPPTVDTEIPVKAGPGDWLALATHPFLPVLVVILGVALFIAWLVVMISISKTSPR